MTTTSTTSEQQTIIDHTISIMSEYDKKMLRDPPYKLSLSMDKLLAPAKRTRKNKKVLNNPRPQNKWIIFRKDYVAKLRLLNPNATYQIQDISKECGVEWKSQPSEVKEYFDLIQRIAFEIHKIMYPNYKYSPKKKDVFCEDNYDEDYYEDDNDENNSNCVVLDPSSINVSNSATMNSAESGPVFDFGLSQYTPIDASPARQLDFHLNTQHSITISVASLSSFSSSNELYSDYNNDDLQNLTFNFDTYLNYDPTVSAGDLSEYIVDDSQFDGLA
ncbi:13483_t:CDS:1 [Ambispora gerdemannii]|uniref:13483_t:CDS:1 n=1 Tax=Ambispora gerdemannii TaxID=144530 RepID=A0A9N8Z2S2_9GLOM|nr:13483_t:CDS:1 [Ambispora gerdemannii]